MRLAAAHIITFAALGAAACTGSIHSPSTTWGTVDGAANTPQSDASNWETDSPGNDAAPTEDVVAAGPDGATGSDVTSPDSAGNDASVDSATDTMTAPDNSGPDVPTPLVKPSFLCDESTQEASVSPLRRLSSRQLTEVTRDLLIWALSSVSEADAVMQDLSPLIAAIPPDVGSERMNQNINDVHVTAHFRLAEAVGAALTANEQRLSTVAGDCAVDGDASNDASCIAAFITNFGLRATRRPVTPAFATFLNEQVYSVAGGVSEGVRDLIIALVASPFFVWQIELGSESETGPDTYALTAHELASRLSLHFWNGSPDTELFDVAADGSLLNQATYEAQVARLAASPRTVATIRSFISEWFDLPHLAAGRDPAAALNTPGYLEFAGDDVPSETLIDEMEAEVLAAASHVIYSDSGTLNDLLTDSRSFATGDELASIYGVQAWDGVSEPATFPEVERRGLLGRALFLANAHWKNTVVRKGVFVIERLMCVTLGAPPDGAEETTTALTLPYTERARVENITSTNDCKGCHTYINPLGAVTEGFDALGRLRADGTEFTHDPLTGESWWIPFDANAGMVLPSSLEPKPVTGPGEAMAVLSDSGYVDHCFAQQYFQFTFARKPNHAVDACTLEAMRSALEAGTPIRDVLAAVALTPTFKVRRVGALQSP